jgi:FG-GAP-like repeat
MKKHGNNSDRASTLQITLSTGLISISAVLFAIAAPTKTKQAPRQDLHRFQLEGSADALGNYPDTSVPLSGDTTVTPDAAPTNTTSINVSTNSNFNGTFAASPTTGVVRVTDAHPAGSYTVTVTAFGPGGTTTKTFTLTVTSTPCGANRTAGFTNAADLPIGPGSMAIGDFNGDGKQDLALGLTNNAPIVSIQLGDGLGGFSFSSDVIVGSTSHSGPTSVAIGDFNGDGKQDLAAATSTNTVSIRLGDGLGGFSGSTEVSVGFTPYSVAIGDFNGDGKQDLAVANRDSNTVSIRLGDGLGGFSGSTEVAVGGGPISVAIGDFNSDGKQDLAVANRDSNTVSIRLGDGLGGGFSGSTDVSVGSYPFSVAIGDFNSDGNQDLAVANIDTNTVSIRLGDGLGGFSGSTEVSVGGSPLSVAIGDFNGDGNEDLAVTRNGNTVSIRLGDGLGDFSGSTEVTVGFEAVSMAIGDFNEDGRQDLAVGNTNPSGRSVSIRLGQCVPGPTPAPVVSISGTVTYCSNPALPPVPGVTMTLTGTSSGSTLTNGSGVYTFSSVASGGSYTVTPTKTARAPGSAGINTLDVIAIQRHFLLLGTPLTGCRLAAADVNGVGGVNTLDVISVQRFFLAQVTGTANTGKYQFSPVNRTYTGVTSNQTAQNYDAIVFGDVGGATFVHRPEGPEGLASDDMSVSQVSSTVAAVALPDVAVAPLRSTFNVPVTTAEIDGKNKLVGFQGDLAFDESVATFQELPVQKAGLTATNWNVSGNVLPGAGRLRLYASRPTRTISRRFQGQAPCSI